MGVKTSSSDYRRIKQIYIRGGFRIELHRAQATLKPLIGVTWTKSQTRRGDFLSQLGDFFFAQLDEFYKNMLSKVILEIKFYSEK